MGFFARAAFRVELRARSSSVHGSQRGQFGDLSLVCPLCQATPPTHAVIW